jgi:diguanylate cyclase (GGDEF)-like protein
VRRAGRVASGALAVLLLGFAGAAAALTSDEASRLLERADDLKTADYAQFASILGSIDAEAAQLSPTQRQHLQYLHGWQSAWDGDYDRAIPTLQAVVADSHNVTLQFRAGITVVNVLALATRYEEALTQLEKLLQLLPRVTDRNAREQGLGVAAYLYNQVGEYDLGLSYAQQAIEENTTGRADCSAGQLKVEALYKSGRLKASSPDFRQVIDACSAHGEVTYANAVRTYVARLHIDAGEYDAAIRLLREHYDELLAARYPRMISEFDALLAEAYRQIGDSAMVRKFALDAIEHGVRHGYTEPLAISYRLLYLLAKEQGDTRAALTYHEQYALADKGYLDDVTARQLAFQRVSHHTVANKLQIDALNKQNEVLQLQQALDRKAAETGRLYIALLTLVAIFIALWAYRTKRSQLHFKHLSRIDGLTGIANRPYFIVEAERTLESTRKVRQEVCIVLCDLDHFKSINDKYGHATGDFVLKQAVAACAAHLRATDLFGRFGGEEFGILLPGCSLADARQRCEQLRGAIAATAAHPSSMVATVSASFGVATTASSGYELRQLLAHADAALYRAKNAGRNRVVLYDAPFAQDSAATSLLNLQLPR